MIASTTTSQDEIEARIPSLLTHGNYVFICVLMSKISPVSVSNGVDIYDKKLCLLMHCR